MKIKEEVFYKGYWLDYNILVNREMKGRNYYLDELDEDLTRQHFNILVQEAQSNGMIHYEISNFAKPQYYSLHNSSYWQGKAYLGIGPSAHSFDQHSRSWNISNNSIYINSIKSGVSAAKAEVLSIEDRYNEYIMTGLRTIWGVSLTKINMDFGAEMESRFLKSIQKYLDLELLEIKDRNVICTADGKFLVDGIAAELFMI